MNLHKKVLLASAITGAFAFSSVVLAVDTAGTTIDKATAPKSISNTVVPPGMPLKNFNTSKLDTSKLRVADKAKIEALMKENKAKMEALKSENKNKMEQIKSEDKGKMGDFRKEDEEKMGDFQTERQDFVLKTAQEKFAQAVSYTEAGIAGATAKLAEAKAAAAVATDKASFKKAIDLFMEARKLLDKSMRPLMSTPKMRPVIIDNGGVIMNKPTEENR